MGPLIRCASNIDDQKNWEGKKPRGYFRVTFEWDAALPLPNYSEILRQIEIDTQPRRRRLAPIAIRSVFLRQTRKSKLPNFASSAANQDEASWVIHLPHASTVIPASVRAELLLSDQDLALELLRMTDHLTDELVGTTFPAAQRVRFPISRLGVGDEEVRGWILEPPRYFAQTAPRKNWARAPSCDRKPLCSGPRGNLASPRIGIKSRPRLRFLAG